MIHREEIEANIAVMNKKTEKKATKFLQETVNSSLSNDVECDPDIQTSFKGIAKACQINPMIGKKQLEKIGQITNDISDKLQDIFDRISKLKVSLINPTIQKFIDNYRAMCDALRIYSEDLSKSRDSDDLDIAYRSVEFQHNEFLKYYNKANDFLGKRTKYEPKSSITGKVWSLVKWVWKYKYIIYISGLLFYNISIYVFPEPITAGLDVVIRIAGAVCYTFASDRVSMMKAQEMIVSMFMLLGRSASILLPSFVQKIIGMLPSSLTKLFSIGSSVVFYIFTYFTVDWISYFLKLICQGILIAGVALRGRVELTEGVWLVFKDAIFIIQGKLHLFSVFLRDSFAKGGEVILEMMTKLFVGILYEGVLKPTGAYVKSIPKRMKDYVMDNITSLWSKPETGVVPFENRNTYEDANELTKKIMDYVQNSEYSSLASQTEIDAGINAVMIIGDEKFQVALSENTGVFVHQVVAYTSKTFGDIKSTGLQAFEQAKEATESTFSKHIREMGTEKLWKDLKKLKFANSIVPYMIGVMMVLSILSIMFGIT